MMVDAINGSSAATTGGIGLTTGAEKALDRDDFLKLLVAQLRNQDPLKPQDNTQFVAELAQFSSLEQTMGINDRLDLLMTQSRGLANTEVTGLVGKQATVRGSMVTTDGTGVGAPVSFTLSGDSEKTLVVVRDQNGREVRTVDLGAKSAGIVRFNWDGRDNAGIVQPAGAYRVSVEARSAADEPVLVAQETSGLVKGVSFEQGYPVLHLDTGVSVPVSDLLRVDAPTTTTNK